MGLGSNGDGTENQKRRQYVCFHGFLFLNKNRVLGMTTDLTVFSNDLYEGEQRKGQKVLQLWLL